MEIQRTFGVGITIDGIPLIDAAATDGSFKSNPTLAAGDVKISIDGGAFTNLTNLPAANPAAGRSVEVVLTAAEMSGQRLVIDFVDQTGPKEWSDQRLILHTRAQGVIRTNVCQAGGSTTTAVLDSTASATDGNYVGLPIRFHQTNGTGLIQDAVVTGYVGASKTVTFSPAIGFSPIATTVFELGRGAANVAAIQATPLANIQTQLSNLLQAPWSTWEATASPLSIAALIPAAFIWSLSAHAGELTTYKTGGSVEFHQYPLSSGPVSSGITQISG